MTSTDNGVRVIHLRTPSRHNMSIEKWTAYFAGQRSALTVPGLPGQARRWCLCFAACAVPIPVPKSPTATTAASANLIVVFIQLSLFGRGARPPSKLPHLQAALLHASTEMRNELPFGHS